MATLARVAPFCQEMPFMRSVLFVAAILVLGSPSHAAAQLRSDMAMTEKKGASIGYYERGCGESWAECQRAELKCDKPGDFKASAQDYSNDEIAAFLSDAKAEAALLVDAHTFKLRPTEMVMNEMNGSWDVSFDGQDSANDIWRALRTAQSLKMKVGRRALVLPITKDFKAAVAVCARGSR